MAGVNLIPDLDRGRLTILEVNAVPGWRTLSQVTGIDVASAVLAAVKRFAGVNFGDMNSDDRLNATTEQAGTGLQPRPAGEMRLSYWR